MKISSLKIFVEREVSTFSLPKCKREEHNKKRKNAVAFKKCGKFQSVFVCHRGMTKNNSFFKVFNDTSNFTSLSTGEYTIQYTVQHSA